MKKIKLNLRFFDGAAGAAEGGAPTAQTAPAGGTASAADANPAEDRAAAYARFKTEYKDMYTADFQRQMDARFKDHKALEGRMKSLDPVLTSLAVKYGVDAKDPVALQQAIDADTASYEQEAEEAGLTVEQLVRTKRLEAEVNAYRAQQESAQREAATNQKLAEWSTQAEKLKTLYPDFDLAAEANNPESGTSFLKLLETGLMDVQKAYEVIHPDVVEARIARGVSYVAEMTQKQTLDTIKAKGMRPSENGAGMPANTKFDVTKATPEQRRAWNERAMRGEAIDLRTGF